MQGFKKTWAIIFGGSSGFGYATAKYLASKGMNVLIIHRDVRSSMIHIQEKIDEIRLYGVKVDSININACDESNFEKIISKINSIITKDEKVKVFIHSISDGNLNEIINDSTQLNHGDFTHTMNTMSLNFIEWSQLLVNQKILKESSRIIGFTSEGSSTVLPSYAAVACAKASLEASCKYLAVKLAPMNITVNLINAGITDTQSLSKFPNYESFIIKAKQRNPSGRLTQPSDVAKAVYLLCLEEASWITGDIIRVDGGEQLLGVF